MTETKDWAAFFNDIDADDKNKVSITLEGFYSGILDDDKFTLEDTALLNEVHSVLTEREIIRNSDLRFKGTSYISLYEGTMSLLGGIYFEWNIFKSLLTLEEELGTTVIMRPLKKLLNGKEMNEENVKLALTEDKGRTMASAVVDYFDSLIDQKPSAIYDLFEKNTETDEKHGDQLTFRTFITTTVGGLRATLEETAQRTGRSWFEKQYAVITLNNREENEVSLVHPRDKKILDDNKH